MLTGGAEPVEATGVPPKGFVRLAPVERQAPGNQGGGGRPGVGAVLSFLVAVGAAMASLQTLIPWAPWRALMQGVGVLMMFGGLGLWAKTPRREVAAGQACACERPPVWIRVIPSVVPDRHPLGESLDGAGAGRPNHRAALVGANGGTRS
jgi:hypothetical protein